MTSRFAKSAVRPSFLYRGSKRDRGPVLYCESISVAELAERFGTPFYVYSRRAITERFRTFDQAFRGVPHTVCYSVKANSNLAILRLLAGMGCGFDVVSGGELERVGAIGQQAAKGVVFSGVGKTPDEMHAALKAGIRLFNVESESELRVLAECAARTKKVAPVALRVNPDVPAKTHPYISTGLRKHKFGIPIDEAERLYAVAGRERWLRVSGVSVHIGSQITDVAPFAATMRRVADLVRKLSAAGHEIQYVDAGGGLGISYEGQAGGEFARQVLKYAKAVVSPLRKLNVHLLLEPGRCIVAPAGILVTRVLYKKTNNAKRFLIVDAAMNDLMRPSLYGAYHEIVSVREQGRGSGVVDVVGPVCESGDFLARDRKLPQVNEGDLLAVLDTGAYGMALASNYNTRLRPAEVLVDKEAAKVIRRRETVRDLLKAEQ